MQYHSVLALLAVAALALTGWVAIRGSPVRHILISLRDGLDRMLGSPEHLETVRDVVIGGGFVGPAIGLYLGAAEGSWLYLGMTFLVFSASVVVAMRIAGVLADLRAADEARMRRTIGGITRSIVTQQMDRLHQLAGRGELTLPPASSKGVAP